MGILQNLQSALENGLSSLTQGNAGATAAANPSTAANPLGNLLSPALLGGLAGALLGGKGAGGNILKGALVAGGGAYLWNKYKDKIQGANASTPQYGNTQSDPKAHAERLVRALVYAAKSDGHIDDQERAAITKQVQQLGLAQDEIDLVQKAIDEPLDPKLVAKGVKNADEALQIFTLSCAAVDIDSQQERMYLDELAAALNIPADVKTDIENKIQQPA